MKKIILVGFFLFFSSILLYSTERDERNQIINQSSQLLQKGDYKTLSILAKTFRETEERTSGGRWKLSFMYSGITRAIDDLVKNKYDNNWDGLEKVLLDWSQSQSQEPVSYITYALFLKSKAWMYRGTNFAKNVPEENWIFFRAEIDKAIKYLIEHKDVASQDPEWYSVMLDLAKLDSWNRLLFHAMVNEAINRYPHYFPIYMSTLYYMHPKWNGYSKEEIENIAQMILKATKDKDGAYARYYWIARDILGNYGSVPDIDINWKIMSESIKNLVEEYPTQYNINAFGYLSCQFNQKETLQVLLNKIENQPLFDAWKGQKNFETCKNFANDNKTETTPTISPDKVISYIENNHDKPILVYFGSHNKIDFLNNLKEIEKSAKMYNDKIDFLPVYISPDKKYAYPHLRMKFFLKDLYPAFRMVYKGKIILRLDRLPSPKRMNDFFKIHVGGILKEMQYTNFLRYFKEGIIDESSFVNTEENIRINTRNYLLSSKKNKAMAVASNMKNNKWVSGRSLNAESQEIANVQALEDCKKDKQRYNNMGECKLYMIHNKYVFEDNNTFVAKMKQSHTQVKEKPKNVDGKSDNKNFPTQSIIKEIPIDKIEKYIDKNSNKFKPLLVYFDYLDTRLSKQVPSKGLEFIANKYKNEFNVVTVYFEMKRKDPIHTSIIDRFNMNSHPSTVIMHKNKVVYNKGGNLNNSYSRKILDKDLTKYMRELLTDFFDK